MDAVLQGTRTPAAAAERVARAQLAVLSRRQLLRLGFERRGIQSWMDRHRLHPLFRGVYLLGHPLPLPGARELGALLAIGPQAILSHRSAAAWFGFLPADPAVVDVLTTVSTTSCQPGIRRHRTTRPPRRQVRIHRGLPVTSPARTLLDLAGAGEPELELALAEAQVQRLVTVTALGRELARHRHQPGVARLRSLLGADSQGFTRSEAERRMRALCRQAQLPQPRTNARLHGYEVDFLWPQARLVVEVDGYSAHGHRLAFERDRRKQMHLVAAGLRMIRISWRQLTHEPLTVVAAIGLALGSAQ